MSTNPVSTGFDQVRANWVFLLVLGILLVLLGCVALSFPWWATLFGVLYYGWTLLIASVFHLASMFYVRRWQGFVLHLVSALLSMLVGLFLVDQPTLGILILTKVVAILLVVGGLFRAITSLFLQQPNWGWSVASGVIAFLLGMAVWRQWPWDSYWFFGLCIAIDFMIQGWTLVMLSLALRPRKA